MKYLSNLMILYCLIVGGVGSYLGENVESGEEVFIKLIIFSLAICTVITAISLIAERNTKAKEERNYKKQLREGIVNVSLFMVTIGTIGIGLQISMLVQSICLRLSTLVILIPPYLYFLKYDNNY